MPQSEPSPATSTTSHPDARASVLGAPIDIDVHDIDANPAKGEGTHQHFDFRFVFYLVPEQHPRLALQDDEVSGARWLDFADVRSGTLRAKLLDARDQGLDGRPEPVNASALIPDGHGRYLLHLHDQRAGIWAPGTFALLGRRPHTGRRQPGSDPAARTHRGSTRAGGDQSCALRT